MKKIMEILLGITLLSFLSVSCGSGNYAEPGTVIIDADEAVKLLEEGEWVLLDGQKTTSFKKEHLEGAVNLERKQIVVSREGVPNILAPPSVIERAAGQAGLTENSNILIYDDNNNMDAGRLLWTFMIYGHKGQLKVVSGGLSALKKEGVSIVKGAAEASPAVYKAGALQKDMLADTAAVLNGVENDPPDYAILDVRSDEEYEAGTIPGSIHVNYLDNDFSDGTFKPVQHIRILYKDHGIMPDDTIVMYCKTSIRAAQTWTALYNAGYRNIKIYDDAWLGWKAGGDLPVYIPEVPGELQIKAQDAS